MFSPSDESAGKLLAKKKIEEEKDEEYEDNEVYTKIAFIFFIKSFLDL